ncbi:MAG: 6,7-dimethyl-8-ribityllumazine synthase [Gammaproteobacteria bacterium]|jgi:6,7-dimethyl-8-ribityllumazine synthase
MTNPVNTIEGDLNARGMRFGIVAAQFNELIVERLVEAAIVTLRKHGADDSDVTLVKVPGSFELPVVAGRMAASRSYDALIALGCVIRGATPHFDYVAGEAASGLGHIARQYDIAVGFGVLTVDTIEQALERAGTKAGNKGADAALAALETAAVLRRISG